MVGDVGAGFGSGHGWHREPEGDALFECCELAELDPLSEGGLSDEEAREQGAGVHVGVGEEPEFFELAVLEEVGFVDEQDDLFASFGFLGGGEAAGSFSQFEMPTSDLGEISVVAGLLKKKKKENRREGRISEK